MCPECLENRRKWESAYQDEHPEIVAFDYSDWPYIVEQADEWVCSQCGLVLNEGDLVELTGEEKFDAEKRAKDRKEYVATHAAELLGEMERTIESDPCLRQMSDANFEYARRAYRLMCERAEDYKERATQRGCGDTYQIKRLSIRHPTQPGRPLVLDDAIIYVNPYNNQPFVLVHYTKEDIEKAGIYPQYEVGNSKRMSNSAIQRKILRKHPSLNARALREHLSKPGVWIPIDREVRQKQLDKIANIPHSRCRNRSDDLSKIVELLSDSVPRTYAEIDRALSSAHGTSKRIIKKNHDQFDVAGAGRRGKPAKVTLKSISLDREEQFY